MATGKRRSIHTTSNFACPSSLNFRPNATQEDRRGTRPTGEPHSIGFVFLSLLLHICKKYILLDTRKRIAIYCGIVFFGSVLADLPYVSIPKTYFSQSDNILNRFFIKWGWAWLLIIAGPWIAAVAYTVGCGQKPYLFKHLARLAMATFAWMMWIRVFEHIERTYGFCISSKDPYLNNRTRCLKAGLFWSGLDISGHTFMIVYTTLILTEEAGAFIGWERIRDSIMNERHTRTIEGEISTSSLRGLSDQDLEFLRNAHNKLSPYLRGLFIVMTIQQMLWDIMLGATVLYYHTIVEKMLGLLAALVTWYITYQVWFRVPNAGLLRPGDGLFKYIEHKKEVDTAKARRMPSRTQSRTFMG